MNDVIALVEKTYEKDGIGQEAESGETLREVFCQIKSISRAEWNVTFQNGLNSSFMAVVNFDDYQNEQEAEYRGKRYGIYRTYAKKPGLMELYLEEKVGVNGN